MQQTLKRVKRSRQHKLTYLRGQQVILNTETLDSITLNETSLAIWEYLGEPKSIMETVEHIAKTFNIPEHQCSKGVNAWINYCLDKKVLSIADH